MTGSPSSAPAPTGRRRNGARCCASSSPPARSPRTRRVSARCASPISGSPSSPAPAPSRCAPAPPRRKERPGSAGKGAELEPAAAELLGRLKALRRRLAAEREVPAYVIFPDRTLEEMAVEHPRTRSELAAIKGVGTAKLAAFGAEFLAVLRG